MNEINVTAGLAGRYKLVVTRADGSTRETEWFDNLILNNGLNRIGTGAIGHYCQVGSGSAAPLVTDTSLQSLVASAGAHSSSDGIGSTPYYGWHRRTYRFNAGVATGNLSEVGIGWTTGSSTLFSRALIRDGGGSPTTITVLADEVLDVIYELRLYPPETDSTFNLLINGTTHTVTCRPSNASPGYWSPSILFTHGPSYAPPMFYAHAGDIGAATGTPSGSSASSELSWDAYSNNSYQYSGLATFGLSSANFPTSIGSFWLFVYGTWAFQFGVSPKIPKNNTNVLKLRVTTSWARKSI